MNQFIDFGPRFIARHIIRQVLLFEDGTAHIRLDDGNWILLSNVDKEAIRSQLNPPKFNASYFTHTGNQ